MPTDCNDCMRLWQRYVAATQLHVNLFDARKAAIVQGDAARAVQIEPIVRGAEHNRDRCKAAIDRHEAEVHHCRATRDKTLLDNRLTSRVQSKSVDPE